jgi:hypothetical protein
VSQPNALPRAPVFGLDSSPLVFIKYLCLQVFVVEIILTLLTFICIAVYNPNSVKKIKILK